MKYILNLLDLVLTPIGRFLVCVIVASLVLIDLGFYYVQRGMLALLDRLGILKKDQ